MKKNSLQYFFALPIETAQKRGTDWVLKHNMNKYISFLRPQNFKFPKHITKYFPQCPVEKLVCYPGIVIIWVVFISMSSNTRRNIGWGRSQPYIFLER